MTHNEPAPGDSPGAEAIRRALADLEAECDRRRNALLKDLRTLEGADKTYVRMSIPEAIEQFLVEHPGPQKLTEVVEKLRGLGVQFGKGGKTPIWIAKIAVGQPVYQKIFRYNKKTDIISLLDRSSS